jgi:parallel beta-helix repeat protein
MRKLMIFVLGLFLFYSTLCVRFNQVDAQALDSYPVHNINTGLNYASIQEAINAPETLNGHTIFVESGTYYEHFAINKSLSLIGQGRGTTIIDGNGTGLLVAANNVNISGFTIRNGGFHGIVLNQVANCTLDDILSFRSKSCISLMNSNRNRILNSEFSNGKAGIMLFNSTENEIINNTVSENWYAGIGTGGPEGSSRNLITNNKIWHNTYAGPNAPGYGLDLVGSDNEISYNSISNNNNGIILDMAYRNLIIDDKISDNSEIGISLSRGSKNNTIIENTIKSNGYGVFLDTLGNNTFYQNNFVNNIIQASMLGVHYAWNNGREGNYWSDYRGVDSNLDGIGDTPYIIDEMLHKDACPLMGMFSSFNTSLGYQVKVVSNSAAEDFQYFESTCTIRMRVSNTTVNQTFGFFRICIPHALMNESYQVTVDGAEPHYVNYTLYDDGGHRWIYLILKYPAHELVIQGISPAENLPPWIVPAIVIIAGVGTALLLYVIRTKKTTRKKGAAVSTNCRDSIVDNKIPISHIKDNTASTVRYLVRKNFVAESDDVNTIINDTRDQIAT